MSDDWRYPDIAPGEWRAMSQQERARICMQAFVRRRDGIFARVRRDHPDWTEQQVLYDALFELYKGDIQPDFLRGAAEHIAKVAEERGIKACEPGWVESFRDKA